jgi:hypothetical protein
VGKPAPLYRLAFFQLSITQSFSVVGIVGKPAPALQLGVFPHFNNHVHVGSGSYV